MALSNEYIYQPLHSSSSIRLMILLPPHSDGLIRCMLQETDIGSLPNYEAISYTWGDESNPSSILCGPNEKQVQITQNLEAALLHFRNADKPRVLWTDRICIDQQNLVERSNQVKLMGKIFARANRVLIWLGPEDEHTALAFSYLDMLEKKVVEQPTHPSITTFKTKSQAELYFGLPSSRSPEFQSVIKLFSRPWFSRGWTYQESVLAQASLVNWGPYSMTGHHILHICRCLQYLDLQMEYGNLIFLGWVGQIATMFYTTEWMGSDQTLYDLLRLLDKRRGVGVTDPRDLLYSVLGVARNVDGLKPDYSKSIHEVFTSAARHIIRTRRDLKLLGRVRQSSMGLPTWVPDWRSCLDDKAFSFLTMKLYHATGSSQVSLKEIGQLGKLCLRGLRVDAIELFTEATSFEEWKVVLKNSVTTFTARYDWEKAYIHTSEPVDIAFFRTYNADLLWESGEGWERWTQAAFRAMRRGVSRIKPARESISTASHRQLFVTKYRRIGLAPLHAQKGDIICLLLGGEVPLLLREAGEEFHFVGECYVHGLMDGEGLVEARKRAQPGWRSSDNSWLNTLHERPPPFDTAEFIIH